MLQFRNYSVIIIPEAITPTITITWSVLVTRSLIKGINLTTSLLFSRITVLEIIFFKKNSNITYSKSSVIHSVKAWLRVENRNSSREDGGRTPVNRPAKQLNDAIHSVFSIFKERIKYCWCQFRWLRQSSILLKLLQQTIHKNLQM